MSNILRFPRATQHLAYIDLLKKLTNTDIDDASAPNRDVAVLQAKVKREIRGALLMLDLAAFEARKIAETIDDPALKAVFDHHLPTIEDLIELARLKAAGL